MTRQEHTKKGGGGTEQVRRERDLVSDVVEEHVFEVVALHHVVPLYLDLSPRAKVQRVLQTRAKRLTCCSDFQYGVGGEGDKTKTTDLLRFGDNFLVQFDLGLEFCHLVPTLRQIK